MSYEDTYRRKKVEKNWLAQRIQNHLTNKVIEPFEIRLPKEENYRFGDRDPGFTITVNDHNGLLALTRFDELRFSEAYINGSLDIEGDMWGVVSSRKTLRDRHPFHTLWRRIAPLISGKLRTNIRAIADHYEYENGFFLKFLDPTRCYSQAIFERDDEPLEASQTGIRRGSL